MVTKIELFNYENKARWEYLSKIEPGKLGYIKSVNGEGKYEYLIIECSADDSHTHFAVTPEENVNAFNSSETGEFILKINDRKKVTFLGAIRKEEPGFIRNFKKNISSQSQILRFSQI